MKINCLKSILLIVVAVCITACEDYLDEKSDQSLVVPSTLQDLQALLDSPFVNNEKSPSWGEASSDNYELKQATFNGLATYEQKAYIWEDYPNEYQNDWARIYDGIYPSNVALEAIENIERTTLNEEAWNNIKGSALFLRAQGYLRAAFTFCKAYDETTANQDLGVVLKQTPNFSEESVRASLELTYQRIISELQQAAELLPVTPQHVMRPSKPAAYALLARTYLSMRDYENAYLYSNLCLELKDDLMDYATELNPNAIIITIPRFNKEVIFSSIISTYTYLNIAPGRAHVKSDLYNSYAVNDLRKPLFFLNASIFGAGPGYFFQGTYDGSYSNLFVGIATDEVWLMRAECNARLGNTEAALSDLNTLMVNRWRNNGTWVPFTANTPQEALELVLTERRKELLFRDLRWMDLKRLNKEGANITLTREINGQTYTLPPNDPRYALLLPQDLIDLTGMPQNPR